MTQETGLGICCISIVYVPRFLRGHAIALNNQPQAANFVLFRNAQDIEEIVEGFVEVLRRADAIETARAVRGLRFGELILAGADGGFHYGAEYDPVG